MSWMEYRTLWAGVSALQFCDFTRRELRRKVAGRKTNEGGRRCLEMLGPPPVSPLAGFAWNLRALICAPKHTRIWLGYHAPTAGAFRRECTDHLIVFNAEHLRRDSAKYAAYYNEVRTHVHFTRPILKSAFSWPIRSLAGYTIDTPEFRFQKRHPGS